MNESFIALNITSDETKLVRSVSRTAPAWFRVFGICRRTSCRCADAGPHKKAGGGRDLRNTKNSSRYQQRRNQLQALQLSFTSSKKIAEAIKFEIADEFPLAQHIVHSIESFSIEPGKKSFLVGIVERELLQKRVREAGEAGLNIIGITNDVSTLGNYFIDENEVLVMEAGQDGFFPSLFSEIADLGAGDPIGLKIFWRRRGIQAETLRPLASEIKRTILSFSAKSHFDLNKIYLSGSFVTHRNLVQILNEATELHFIDQSLQQGNSKSSIIEPI